MGRTLSAKVSASIPIRWSMVSNSARCAGARARPPARLERGDEAAPHLREDRVRLEPYPVAEAEVRRATALLAEIAAGER